jgi:hypothetical protein
MFMRNRAIIELLYVQDEQYNSRVANQCMKIPGFREDFLELNHGC